MPPLASVSDCSDASSHCRCAAHAALHPAACWAAMRWASIAIRCERKSRSRRMASRRRRSRARSSGGSSCEAEEARRLRLCGMAWGVRCGDMDGQHSGSYVELRRQAVEGRGRAWKGVEGRGRAWKGVEGTCQLGSRAAGSPQRSPSIVVAPPWWRRSTWSLSGR